MARQLRIQVPGGIHHITARGNDRQPIFVDDVDRRTFLQVLGEAAKRYDCSVHAFCLMTNHVHLALEDRRGQLSRALRHINGTYAQRFNQQHGRTGHVFERRFWSSLLETDQYLTTAVEYIHRNPVEAGLVTSLPNHQWSSYPAYLGMRRPQRFLALTTVMAYYGNDVELFRRSTENLDRSDPKYREFGTRNPPPVFGSLEFQRRAVDGAGRCIATESAHRKLLIDRERPSIQRIVDAVAAAFDVDVTTIDVSVRGQRNRARSCAVYLAHHDAGWPLGIIAEHFGLTSPSSVSMTSKRFGQLVENEPDTRRALTRSRRTLASDEQVTS